MDSSLTRRLNNAGTRTEHAILHGDGKEQRWFLWLWRNALYLDKHKRERTVILQDTFVITIIKNNEENKL